MCLTGDYLWYLTRHNTIDSCRLSRCWIILLTLRNHHWGQIEVKEKLNITLYLDTFKPEKKMPTATFCAMADVSSLFVMQLIRFRHKPVLGRNDRMHTDAAVRSSSLMQQKTVKASLLIPLSPSLNNTSSRFLWNRLRRPDLLRRLTPSLTAVLWNLQTFKSCHPVKSPGHLFLKQGRECRVSPLSAPFTSQSCHAGRGRAGGSDSFSAASPTPPFMLDRVKAPGLLLAERQENKIKSVGSAWPPSPGLGDSCR